MPQRFYAAQPDWEAGEALSRATARPTPRLRRAAASIPDGRDTDLPEVFRRYVTEDLVVDPVIAKNGLVLVETEIAEPPADVHAAPHLASGDIGALVGNVSSSSQSVQLALKGPGRFEVGEGN